MGGVIMKKTVCIDLNGVLDRYTGWKGEGHMDPPRPGAERFLAELAEDYRVVILTTQQVERVWAWLQDYGLDRWVDEVTDRKPPAVVYVDDRAVTFRGNFEETLQEIRRFRPHWKKPKEEEIRDAKAEAKAILKDLLDPEVYIDSDVDRFVKSIIEAAAEEVAARLREGLEELEKLDEEGEA
jgi:hypothetical protein